MDLLPLFLKLSERPCLVVGGGAAAAGKVDLLLRAGARVTVAADRLSAELERWRDEGRIEQQPASEAAALVAGRALVIVASEDGALARRIAAAAEAANIPINLVDRPELSSAIMGAVIDRSPVVVAVSTGGAAPVLAREIKSAIERLLPSGLGRLARFAGHFRSAVKAAIPQGDARRRFWESLFEGPVAATLLAGEEQNAPAAMLSLINRARENEPGGIVHIVGAGPGDPDLLTVKALRLLSRADVVIYDRLVGPGILERARRDAERIPVGKAKGRHSHSQSEINALVAAHARAGRRVVRLKGGDPFIFGRGGEELEYLRARGIVVEVVPGISAALGCAAAAQIPLTHRDLASAVTLVSGHGTSGEPELDWASLARTSGTLAIYMGASVAGTIARQLVAHGLAPDTPAAIIENGTREDERRVIGRLADLESLVEEHGIAGPALILLGEVVRLAREDGAAAALPLLQAVNA
jgi:uroporphyrin-III C-methyltransferase / precorrin-2 dehydrogenase / sirohydrochlorin ferrochelatase